MYKLEIYHTTEKRWVAWGMFKNIENINIDIIDSKFISRIKIIKVK